MRIKPALFLVAMILVAMIIAAPILYVAAAPVIVSLSAILLGGLALAMFVSFGLSRRSKPVAALGKSNDEINSQVPPQIAPIAENKLKLEPSITSDRTAGPVSKKPLAFK
jgi:hypothetical protein